MEATWLYAISRVFTLESESALVTLAHQAVCRNYLFRLYLDLRRSQDSVRCQHSKFVNKRRQERSRPAHFFPTGGVLSRDRQGECGCSRGEKHIPIYQRALAGARRGHARSTAKGGYSRAKHAPRTGDLA